MKVRKNHKFPLRSSEINKVFLENLDTKLNRFLKLIFLYCSIEIWTQKGGLAIVSTRGSLFLNDNLKKNLKMFILNWYQYICKAIVTMTNKTHTIYKTIQLLAVTLFFIATTRHHEQRCFGGELKASRCRNGIGYMGS